MTKCIGETLLTQSLGDTLYDCAPFDRLPDVVPCPDRLVFDPRVLCLGHLLCNYFPRQDHSYPGTGGDLSRTLYGCRTVLEVEVLLLWYYELLFVVC